MNVYVLRLAEEMARSGYPTDVYTRLHNPDEPSIIELASGARVVHLPGGPTDATKEELPQYLPEFSANLQHFVQTQQLRYDLLHSHYWLSGWAGLDLARAWEVPHVVTFHTLAEVKVRVRFGETETEMRFGAERQVADLADAIVVNGEHERDALQRLYASNEGKVHVISPGVDHDLFRPLDQQYAQEAIGLEGRRVLLFVGRLDSLKGLELLVQAVSMMDDLTDVELVIVGGDPDRRAETIRLKTLASQLGVGAHVRFTGPVPHERLPFYYNSAEVLVMPSYYESFGLAALEAMACGTPVVAARVGGLASLVEDGETGYLVPWHCPEPFSRRLEVLLTHRNLRDTMGRAARQKALARDWGVVARETLDLYHALGDALHRDTTHGPAG